MTIFAFNTFNHCEDGRRCLEDVTAIMSAQLRVLGHETSESCGEFTDAGYNVLYESFADDGVIPAIAAAHARGCRFLYVATEEPTALGAFGGRFDNAMDARQAVFPEAARFASGILHLVPGTPVTAWYDRYAPAAYAELGYAERLVYRGPSAEPVRPFGFYGQLTPRRAAIIARLGTENVEILPFITHSAAERDAAMRRVRVILQIRAHDSMQTISSSRCATALNLGRPVAGEPHAQGAPWDRIVQLSETADEFYDLARATAADWRCAHAEQLARFAAALPPETCLGEPLRRLGIA